MQCEGRDTEIKMLCRVRGEIKNVMQGEGHDTEIKMLCRERGTILK
jgi:hypothetical protein